VRAKGNVGRCEEGVLEAMRTVLVAGLSCERDSSGYRYEPGCTGQDVFKPSIGICRGVKNVENNRRFICVKIAEIKGKRVKETQKSSV
jgi:hypothetical protein